MNTPANWSHKSGYRLNADGKSIEYTHDSNSLLAIIEATVNESDEDEGFMEYYTVIFNTEGGRPWSAVESHQFFREKDSAKANLDDLMAKHA